MKFRLTKKRIIFVAVFGLAGFVAIAWLLLTGPRMRNQPSLRAYETQVNLPPENSFTYTPEKTKTNFSFDLENTDTNVQKGKTYYGYYCVFCHGTLGDGNGPVGQSYIPKPANLGNDSIQQYSISRLYETSFTGTGHAPVLERVVPEEFRPYILLYIQQEFGR